MSDNRLADEAAYFGAVQDGVDSQQELIESLHQQLKDHVLAGLEVQKQLVITNRLLAESQAREQQAKRALYAFVDGDDGAGRMIDEALDMPSDSTALDAAIAALKEALQHDAEPVAYLEPNVEHSMCCHKDEIDDEVKGAWIPLVYASPQPTKGEQ